MSDWNTYKQAVLRRQKSLPGWCPPDKASKMMDLIYKVHPSLCVEIGVFGGSSYYPTAAALQLVTPSGRIYGIDPWAKQPCLVGYTPDDPNSVWWSKVNLDQIYKNLKTLISTERLSVCHTLRMTSQQAVSQFEDGSIDILHIDGNHCEASALADVEQYLPKVHPGGYIWFDDINWKSTNRAVSLLKEKAQYIPEQSTSGYALFQKPV